MRASALTAPHAQPTGGAGAVGLARSAGRQIRAGGTSDLVDAPPAQGRLDSPVKGAERLSACAIDYSGPGGPR